MSAIIVNLIGAPGTGKSTLMAAVFAKLKCEKQNHSNVMTQNYRVLLKIASYLEYLIVFEVLFLIRLPGCRK